MLDFAAVRARTLTIQELAAGLAKDDLAAAARAMTDDVLARIEGCDDPDVIFVPIDPNAHDEFAADVAEVGLAWTLGHVIVHVTASAEEAAFIAAELARGVAREGRSRYESPWATVTTIDGCRRRLHESLRMILATLDAWPDEPHLGVTLPGATGPRNAIARFLSGLSHADSHREQVSEIVRQARTAHAAAGA